MVEPTSIRRFVVEETAHPEVQGATCIDATNARVFQCSREVFDTLNHCIACNLNRTSDAWNGGQKPSVASKIYNNMINSCGVTEARTFDHNASNLQAFCTIETPGIARRMFR